MKWSIIKLGCKLHLKQLDHNFAGAREIGLVRPNEMEKFS